MASIFANRGYPAGARNDQLLASDRVPQIQSPQELAAIAETIETQAIERYRAMARLSARRGNAATARALLQLSAKAEAHAAALHWPAGGVGRTSDLRKLADALPPDFAASWEEARDSALLTPYRALAIAVTNEQRAFVLFSYLAAQASDPKVAKEAERLALLKLEHAERLRRLRRAAYHEERPGKAGLKAPDLTPLENWLPRAERDIAISHRSIADALTKAGDEESAALLRTESIVRFDTLPAQPTSADLDLTDIDSIHLLTTAQKPLEQLIERLEAALDRGPEESVYRQSQEHLERAVLRLGAIKSRVAELSRAEGARSLPGKVDTTIQR